MKILIVIDTLASGGAQKLKVQLAKGLLNRNHEVEMCIYDSNYPFYERQLRNAGIKTPILVLIPQAGSFDEITNFEVDSIELAAPKLFSDDENIESQDNQYQKEEKEMEAFDGQETEENLKSKESEMFPESESKEDFEIPAFLRRQKN